VRAWGFESPSRYSSTIRLSLTQILVPRKRKWTDEQFIEAVRNGRSVRGVLQAIGLNPTGANYRTVADTAARLTLDTSHWKGQGYLKGLSHNLSRKTPMEEILVGNSTFHNLTHLKGAAGEGWTAGEAVLHPRARRVARKADLPGARPHQWA
jgi:hypothetical protein